MSRVSRNSTDCLYYHVMVQGINKINIFEEEYQKKKYKELIKKKSTDNKILIFAYCIMNNHVHILVKIPASEALSKMMQQVNTGYGKYYNYKLNRVGYVFRDRYRAEPIRDMNHLYNCIRYIHENPVKADMCRSAEEYAFSSVKDYKNNIIHEEVIKEIFGEDKNIDLTQIVGIYQNYDFIEVNNEFGIHSFEDFDFVCEEYLEYDYSQKNNIYLVANELKKRTNATNEQIMGFLGIKKTTYYKIMKEGKKVNF